MLKKLAATGVISFAAFGIALAGSPAHADTHTSGDGGIVSGNQISIPISVPVNVCGNAIAVLGGATAGCHGGASVNHQPKPSYPHHQHHPRKPRCPHHHPPKPPCPHHHHPKPPCSY